MTDQLEEGLSRAVSPVPPPPALAEAIRRRVASSSGPVRPLAPPALRAVAVVLPGLVVALAFAAWRGLLDPLPGGRLAAVLVTLAVAGVGAWLALRSVVPGSAPADAVAGGFLLAPLLFAALAAVFCSGSLPLGPAACLWTGLTVAVFPAAIGLTLLLRGFPLTRVRSGALVGLAAGLFGLGMLHLTCPLTSLAHLLVMHGGVLVVALGIGAVLGRRGV